MSKFQVGDRVKCGDDPCEVIGFGNSEDRCRVRFDDSTTMYVGESELSRQPTPAKFKVGDMVRTAWGKEVATIVSVHVSGKLFGVSYNGSSPQNYHEDWLTLVDEQKQPMGFDDKNTWDGEWLNSIGFADDGKDGWSIMLPNGCSLNIGHDYDACLTDRDRKLYLTSRIYFTKGDVRLLCAALVAELKGGA